MCPGSGAEVEITCDHCNRVAVCIVRAYVIDDKPQLAGSCQLRELWRRNRSSCRQLFRGIDSTEADKKTGYERRPILFSTLAPQL